MAPKRYELSEKQWVRISPLIAGKASDPGRTGTDNRLFVNAVLWVIRSGTHWHDLPERYGKYKGHIILRIPSAKCGMELSSEYL